MRSDGRCDYNFDWGRFMPIWSLIDNFPASSKESAQNLFEI